MKKNFKTRARQHQVRFRTEILKEDFYTYITWLADKASRDGKNFYNGFEIFNVVRQRKPKFYIDLYSDMLRSEHIPFNLFVPFRHNLDYCKNVFNEFLGGCIKSIDKTCIIDNKENIKIEFAPKPKENYLNDGTSFDTYIEYTHIDNSKGLIGIEVKYTEKEYPLKAGSKQEQDINNKNSRYYSVSKLSDIYDNSLDLLPTDIFRQIWRNQLLAESIRLTDNNKFKHSTSMTFFPEDNVHFVETSTKYINMLKNKSTKFIPVTYERFFSACNKYCPMDNNFKEWIEYLEKRYIVTDKE